MFFCFRNHHWSYFSHVVTVYIGCSALYFIWFPSTPTMLCLESTSVEFYTSTLHYYFWFNSFTKIRNENILSVTFHFISVTLSLHMLNIHCPHFSQRITWDNSECHIWNHKWLFTTKIGVSGLSCCNQTHVQNCATNVQNCACSKFIS